MPKVKGEVRKDEERELDGADRPEPDDLDKRIFMLMGTGISVRSIAGVVGVPKSTVHLRIKRMREYPTMMNLPEGAKMTAAYYCSLMALHKDHPGRQKYILMKYGFVFLTFKPGQKSRLVFPKSAKERKADRENKKKGEK